MSCAYVFRSFSSTLDFGKVHPRHPDMPTSSQIVCNVYGHEYSQKAMVATTVHDPHHVCLGGGGTILGSHLPLVPTSGHLCSVLLKKMVGSRAGEMASCLRVLAALLDDPDLVTSIHVTDLHSL